MAQWPHCLTGRSPLKIVQMWFYGVSKIVSIVGPMLCNILLNYIPNKATLRQLMVYLALSGLIVLITRNDNGAQIVSLQWSLQRGDYKWLLIKLLAFTGYSSVCLSLFIAFAPFSSWKRPNGSQQVKVKKREKTPLFGSAFTPTQYPVPPLSVRVSYLIKPLPMNPLIDGAKPKSTKAVWVPLKISNPFNSTFQLAFVSCV